LLLLLLLLLPKEKVSMMVEGTELPDWAVTAGRDGADTSLDMSRMGGLLSPLSPPPAAGSPPDPAESFLDLLPPSESSPFSPFPSLRLMKDRSPMGRAVGVVLVEGILQVPIPTCCRRRCCSKKVGALGVRALGADNNPLPPPIALLWRDDGATNAAAAAVDVSRAEHRSSKGRAAATGVGGHPIISIADKYSSYMYSVL